MNLFSRLSAEDGSLPQSILEALPYAMLLVTSQEVLENERWTKLWPWGEGGEGSGNGSAGHWLSHHERCRRMAADHAAYNAAWKKLGAEPRSELVPRRDGRIVRRHLLPLRAEGDSSAPPIGWLLLDETPIGSTILARAHDGDSGEEFPHLWQSLTARECTVIELVLDGQTNRQIAEFLGIAEKTVERHRSSSMQKLRCRHLVDLVRSMSSMPLESNSARKPVNGSGGDGSCGNEAGDS